MPRLPGWAWLLLAIGFATLATYMAMGYLKRQAAVRPPAQEKIYVVRASTKAEKEKILSVSPTQARRMGSGQASPGFLFRSEGCGGAGDYEISGGG